MFNIIRYFFNKEEDPFISKKWETRFMDLAEYISTWSRDPSTKVGAVLVRPNKSVASIGFNGFPQGTNDDEALYLNREEKLKRVVHAEINALTFCTDPKPYIGYTLFTYPFMPCAPCAGIIIQHNIANVIAPKMNPEAKKRWSDIMKTSEEMFSEKGMHWHYFEK